MIDDLIYGNTSIRSILRQKIFIEGNKLMLNLLMHFHSRGIRFIEGVDFVAHSMLDGGAVEKCGVAFSIF